MNRNELRDLKYRTIVNALGDAKKARRARDWSAKRIYKEYGITLPKEKPPLKENAPSVKTKVRVKKTRPKNKSDTTNRIYEEVYALTGDKQLAKNAKRWTSERIQKELGVKISSKARKPYNELSKAYKSQRKREYKKFQQIKKELLNKGLSNSEASKIANQNKKKSYKDIDKFINLYKFNKTNNQYKFKDYDNFNFDEKVILWSNWARRGNQYPDEIINAVHYINKEKGLDSEHHLGWYVVYQGFLFDQDINDIKKYIEVNTFMPDEYIDVRRYEDIRAG